MAAGFSCRRSSCRRVADFCWRERLWLKLWATKLGEIHFPTTLYVDLCRVHICFLILAIWCNLHVLWCIFGTIDRLQQKHRVPSSCVSSYLNSAPLGQGETMNKAHPPQESKLVFWGFPARPCSSFLRMRSWISSLLWLLYVSEKSENLTPHAESVAEFISMWDAYSFWQRFPSKAEVTSLWGTWGYISR